VDRVCPLLGLHGDHRTAIDGVDGAHRCHADDPPLALDRQQQARVCLTAEHERCDRYLAHANRIRTARRASSGVVGSLVSTRMVLSPDPAWRGIAGRSRRTSTWPLLVIGIVGVVLGLGGLAIVRGFAEGDLSALSVDVSVSAQPSGTELAMPTASATPSATPSGTPTPTPDPSTSPTATSSATTEPTVAPTATPAPAQETYIVQAGDTLAAIAERFATTASALQAANGIEDANEIAIGQILVIP